MESPVLRRQNRIVLRNGMVKERSLHSGLKPSSDRVYAALPSRFSIPWIAVGLLLLAWLVPAAHGAVPLFENRTPVGFSTQDSTTQGDFVESAQINVRVDLNQAATPTYPVIGNFHNVETSKIIESTDVDGLRSDIAISDAGVLHVAWISQEVVSPVITPAYYVRYARSEDSGKTFSTPNSVSGTLRFDILTLNGSGTSFSTVDIEVDSRGNPRVAYAFDHSPDGHVAKFVGNNDNVYLNYSEDGGSTWLPGNSAVTVNDEVTAGNTQGRSSAFPRMAIDQRDNVFITYVRGNSQGTGADDVMLARVNRGTSPFSMEKVGSLGTAGSAGGVRLGVEADRQTGPDIAIGSGDVLHVVYFNDTDNNIEHKTLLADSWSTAGVTGWNQDVDGAAVDGFTDEAANNVETDAIYYFPTVVVDKQSSPDKIYALYKYADATFETVFFNNYTYDNAIGGSAGWNTGSAAAVWSTSSSAVFSSGNQNYNIELEWTVTERVAAVVDERLPNRGELHIAFSAGYSSGNEHDIYYGFYNGVSWSLPEKVADDDAGSQDGVTDTYLAAPALAKRADDDNVYLVFAGGSGEGLGVDFVTNVNHHPYFKVLGRAVTFEDQSQPVGAFAYDLAYMPVNGHNVSSDLNNNMVSVYVADNSTGEALGATGKPLTDGFLAGDWERVGITLGDDDKNFEGKINENTASEQEWGDDDDKVNLLVKLNVLGSDSATNGAVPGNVQIITSSSAANSPGPAIQVGTNPRGNFVAAGDFFLLGADIDIIDSNTAPQVSISEPDGSGDVASRSYAIHYDLNDPDDNISSGQLKVSFYYAPDSTLASVQDVQIFGTLIADENDNSTVFASGTDDFADGINQTYTWDDPPQALKDKLFASIQQALSRTYYIYLVADDQKNPPVFARSPGALTILHKPIIEQVAPTGADTVDTGVRSGDNANPYDLDFFVRDFDLQGTAQVQLFYSSVSGLTSVSASGVFPNQKFTLGKSLAGNRAIRLTNSETLTSSDSEFSWDVTDSVCAASSCAAGDSIIVAEGSYFIYAVSSDSVNVSVGQSQAQLIVKHSPSFTFYEPPRDTHRRINTGSQPIYAIQWQKGPGDQDFDDNATVDFYFTRDDPVNINYENFPDSLLLDSDTEVIVTGLSEDGDGSSDMYIWDLRSPANDVPREGRKVFVYAIITDSRGNKDVALGGALTMTHDPHILLTTAKLDDYSSFLRQDVLRLTWDDYLVDDGYSTDNAYIRLYASAPASAWNTINQIEGDVGTNSFLINSSNGLLTGTIATIREDSVNFFDWNTRLFGSASTSYEVYAAISKDPTFSNNTARTFSKSVSDLAIGVDGTTSNISVSPTDFVVAIGDTMTMDVMVQYTNPINFVQVVFSIGSTENSFRIVDQSTDSGIQPFVDLDNVFSGTTPIENTYLPSAPGRARQMRFSKSSFSGQTVGSTTEPAALARFQLVATSRLKSTPILSFSGGETGTVVGRVGQSDPVDDGEGLTLQDPQFTRAIRGSISATVELEGRTLGNNNHTTLLDVHLREPGSTIDITDAVYISANDDFTSTTDTVEVQTDNTTGALSLVSIPPGRYVLTVKDTSHVSGRTDTITVVRGATTTISSGNDNGFFGSDLRGDPTPLLTSTGRVLVAGDASEDNEINEDDVNIIIAAWGTDTAVANFNQADINNDLSVGAPDLTVTTSNFGNSEGFGAPPVFKGLARGDNGAAVLDVEPLFDPRQPLVPGQQIELAVKGRGLDDLAGYFFDLNFDPAALRPLGDGAVAGDIFDPNPRGAVFTARQEQGHLEVLAARIGKQWSARGEGTLAQLRFEVLRQDALQSLRPGESTLLNTSYRQHAAPWERGAAEWFLPGQFELTQNFPNPFNPTTVIPFALPGDMHVRLAIYNILGQQIRTLVDGPMHSGFHRLMWNGHNDRGRQVAAGVYFYLLEAGPFRQTRKMTLVK